jgi:hypothetical protein
MSYALKQTEYKCLKTRLTKAQNKFNKIERLSRGHFETADSRARIVKAARELLAEANYGLKVFEQKGSPDSWADWERAKDDAHMHIQRNGGNA